MADILVPIAISSQLDDTGEERIHAAQFTPGIRIPYSPPLTAIYADIKLDTFLAQAIDGLTFTDDLQAGGTIGTNISVGAGGGRLFRFGSTIGRVTTDGTTFLDCTNVTGSGAAVRRVIYTEDEWLLFKNTTNVLFSSDGVDFASRSLPASFNGDAAMIGDTIVAAQVSTTSIMRSTDKGVNWATVNTGITSTTHRVLATPTGFLTFGSNSGNAIRKSLDGSLGTWSSIAAPGAEPIMCAAHNTTTGRVIAVARFGVTWYSDDDGETWTQGGTIPMDTSALAPANSILFANDLVYMVGQDVNSDFGIYTTPDGVAWTLRHSGGDFGTVYETLAAFSP